MVSTKLRPDHFNLIKSGMPFQVVEEALMLNRRFALIAALVFLLCGAPTTLNASAGATPPVTVQACSVDGKWQTLDVHFTISGSRAVTIVHFALMTESGPAGMSDDVGSYPPGVVVRHRLRVDPMYLQMYADFDCVPATVTFQDGTTWQNPVVAGDMEHALPQTPGSHIAFSRCFIGDGADMWFRNTAQQVATEVDLGMLQQGLLVYELETKGTFTPGVLVQRGYGSLGGKGNVVSDDMMHTTCVVLAVHYVDGSSWSNPSPPARSLKGIPFTVDPTAAAPVKIERCDASSATADYNGNWRLSYQNTSSKPIVAADFAIVMHGVINAAARDLHDLSPGDSSSPHFLLWDPKVFHPQCIPLRVNFADGTKWENPLFTK